MDGDDWNAGAYCDRERAHPRAVSLMVEDFLWNTFADDTPFGSDEGYEGYYSWREWRSSNPDANLINAVSWILDDDRQAYLNLAKEDNPQKAFGNSSFIAGWDLWTLNITIISTALSQLLDEGTIDDEAKPYVYTATAIERSPRIENSGFMPAEVLDAIDRVVAAA